VLVPVRFLEPRAPAPRAERRASGAGQGAAIRATCLRPGREQGERSGKGGTENGEIKFVVELKIDEIVDWPVGGA